MKRLFILAVFITSFSGAIAQNKELSRTIEVTGIAETEVTPDIIDVSISLQEYMGGKKRITIVELEQQLKKAVEKAGIPAADFTIKDVDGWRNYYERKKNTAFLASKQYNIRVHNLNKYNEILSRLDSKGIESTEVWHYDYSKITELKRDLKIQALLAARTKASYLLGAIDEKLGRVITISETDPVASYYQPSFYSNSIVRTNDSQDSEIGYKKMKLSFQVHAVFEIK